MEIARMEAGQVPAVAALERQCFSEPWWNWRSPR